MTVEVPNAALGAHRFSNEEARIDYAIGLYSGRKVSMGKAAKIAGIGYIAFMRELGDRGICLNYGVEDLEHDLATLEKFFGKREAEVSR